MKKKKKKLPLLPSPINDWGSISALGYVLGSQLEKTSRSLVGGEKAVRENR